MAEHTKIEWADATVNFWAGCTKVSPACDHCYAEKMAGRLWGTRWGPGERRLHFMGAAETLAKLDRKAQKMGVMLSVFINSISDFFDNAVDNADRMDAIEVLSDCRHLRPLLLTKRIGNVAPYLQRDSLAFDLISSGRIGLGITVCNQAEANRDIPKVMAVPAGLRFLSLEPLLGPVDLLEAEPFWHPGKDGTGAAMDWVIVGGESGPGARPMHPDWARSLRDQCQAAGVPFFFKQWGEWLPAKVGRSITGHVLVLEGSAPFSKNPEWHGFEDGQRVARVGKKAAGRLLDGVEHNGRPA